MQPTSWGRCSHQTPRSFGLSPTGCILCPTILIRSFCWRCVQHAHAHARTHARTHTHTLSLSLTHTHKHTHTYTHRRTHKPYTHPRHIHTDTSLTVILRHLKFSDQLKIAYNYIAAIIAAAPRPSRRVAAPLLQPRRLHAFAVYRTALHCRRESARLLAFLQRPGAARYRPSHAQGAAASF